MSKTQTVISKDAANKKLVVTRSFDAPRSLVWKAWTESSLLDQWWAPKPWKAETKSLELHTGGMWLYCMLGPDGTKSWSRVDFETVTPESSFTATVIFCDENGIVDESFPSMHWDVTFESTGESTSMTVTITFSAEADMKQLIEMGFEQGFTMGLGNLDELLAKEAI